MLDRHYWADGHGGYYFAADDTDDLIVRTINAHDDATPNANGTMVSNLVALYLWTGEERYRDRAEEIVRGFSGAVAENVFSHTGLLTGVHRSLAPAHIVIVVPEGGDANAAPRARRCVAAERRGAGGQSEGSRSGELTRAWQAGDRGQADRLCLHRPAMLRAGDGASDAGRGGAGGTGQLTSLFGFDFQARLGK